MMVELDGEAYFIEQLSADEVHRVIESTEAVLAELADPMDAALLRLNLTALRQHADMLADEEHAAEALHAALADCRLGF
jgi:hypothetical protein